MTYASFPMARPRRLRQSGWVRNLVTEEKLGVSDLIWPIFICDGKDQKSAVASMPGVFRLSIDHAVEAARKAADLGIPLLALFPYTDPSLKTAECGEAWNPANLVNQATRAIKKAVPNIGIMLDVALDPYNSLGHDGIVKNGVIVNDLTLEALEKQAIVQAESGADVLGPSDMMDGRIGVIRKALDAHQFHDCIIMSYAAKFASAFYGPFRDAVGADGALKGDKKTYQINPANRREALLMVERDLKEGADLVMVKPGMPYLDICREVSTDFRAPVFAYQVSGEYAMIEAAAKTGAIDRKNVITEALLAFKRAGCHGVLTYHAFEVATWLSKQ